MVIHRILLYLCLLPSFTFAAMMGERAAIDAALSPPDLMSPRPVQSCATALGVPAPCIDGGIRWGDASVDGQVVLFDSGSNRLVPGDTNGSSDIFVWQAGHVQRVSTGPAGEQADHASDRAALSGNGRYVYFRSFAGNLATGALRSHLNLYVKDLATGRLALISRDVDGVPANLTNITQNFTQIDADFSGRYVVFASAFAEFVAGISDGNQAEDIFLADLDPDHNGDFFDTPAQIHLLSVTTDGSTTGDRASFNPSIRQDGRAVVWLTRAMNLLPELAGNGTSADVLLAQLGVLADGSLDPNARSMVAINRMGDGAALLTPQGARLARIAPWRDQIAFVSADDIPGSGDSHPGQDLYLSVGDYANSSDRHLIWMSHAYSITEPTLLDLAWDPLIPPAAHSQVAWVAHGDLRPVDDLLIQRSAPFHPEGWTTVNWVEAATPSSAPVESGGLSADGRFAFWTTTEAYGLDVPPGSINLFRRQIAPPQSVPLTIHAVGGTVSSEPPGAPLDGSTLYPATTLVELTPHPAAGYHFAGWMGVDARAGVTATVALYTARTITATFDPIATDPVTMTVPIAADLTVTTAEDTLLEGITLDIIDPDPGDTHTVVLAAQASHGVASIHNNVISYQPEVNFFGEDHFALQVIDGAGLQLAEAAQVTVRVTPVNDAPVVVNATGNGVNNGSAIPVWVTVEDPDPGDTFVLQVETPPTAGSVEAGSQLHSEGHFDYTPTAGFAGVDHFTFRVTDSGSASIVATATVTVTLDTPLPDASELLLPTLRR
ncbi:MAG: cadherin-like domain-containing protein [Caldilineaceae bacterium]|nr:cadherin-like domain-containing protein [Caldilineaceae bacterium]